MGKILFSPVPFDPPVFSGKLSSERTNNHRVKTLLKIKNNSNMRIGLEIDKRFPG
jgi:hypothetical protein